MTVPSNAGTSRLLLLLATLPLLFAAAAAPGDLVDVFVAGDDFNATGVKQFRIPALVRTGSGALLAFAEARTDPATDCAYKWLVVRRSEDEGATWSASVDVVGREWARWATGNAQAVFHAPSGRVVMTFGSKDTSVPGYCEPGTVVMAVDDGGSDGRAWGPPRNISGDLGAQWATILPGPGASVVLAAAPHAGRIVATGVTDAYGEVISYFSDDAGLSWRAGRTPLRGGDESAPTELPDGRVYVTMRNDHLNESCACQAFAISEDGGETFGPMRFDATLVSPVCEGSVAVLGGRLLFANPASKTQRRDITVRATAVGAADPTAWQWSLLLAPGLTWGGYTSLASGGAGFAAALLERNTTKGDVISFARFALPAAGVDLTTKIT